MKYVTSDNSAIFPYLSTKLFLIFGTISSMFVSFLYMNIYIGLVFVLFSLRLCFLYRHYIFGYIMRYIVSVFSFFIALSFISLLFIIIRNPKSILHFCVVLFSIILYIVFSKKENIVYAYFSIKYILYFYITALIAYLYFTRDYQYPVGYTLEYVVDNVSANGVTSFANVLSAIFTALSFVLFRKTTLISSLFVLYICIEGYGRGSIIFATFMCLINVVFYFRYTTKLNKLIILFVGLFFLFYLFEDLSNLYKNTKLVAGFDTPRVDIFYDYVQGINFYTFFFGASYNGTVISEIYNNNPHIAYIRAHHIFGISYILFLIFIMFTETLLLLFEFSFLKFIIFLIILNILIRCVSEPILFSTVFDSLFFLLLNIHHKIKFYSSIIKEQSCNRHYIYTQKL